MTFRRLLPCLLFILLCATSVSAKQTDTSLPVDFSADEIVYDRKLSLIIARGNVEATQGNTYLKADHVTYDMKDNSMIATGNVMMKNDEAGVVYSNYAQVTGNLKSGIVKEIRFVLNDKSVLLADRGEHREGNYSDFYNVAYSSCDFCLDGSRFWEIKAQKLSHDKAAQDMSGQNITLHVKDIPVFYFPYFSYPDPTVKRRTGFLIPAYRSTSELGSGIQLPFYWEITDYTDLLLNPIIAQKRILYSGIFRQTFKNGNFDFYGTQTHDEIGQRYSVDSHLNWDINDIWYTRAHLNKSSDDTYIRRYDITGYDNSDAWLDSSLEITALTDSTLFSLEGLKYQNLRENVADGTFPNNIPLLTFSHATERDDTGSYWTFDASSVYLSQNDGLDSTRLSGIVGWHMADIIYGGAVFDLDATARGDVYDVKNYKKDATAASYSGQTGRFHPQASLTARYPFITIEEKYSQILEPIVMGIVAPNTSNSDKIPNEDSQDFDFDDTFLFSDSRFVGYDLIEPGSRINYALRWSLYGRENGMISALIGQSYRFSTSSVFPDDSGLEDNFSDYVGRITLRPSDFLNLEYAFRLSHENFQMRRNDLQISVGNSLLRVGATYMYLKKPSYLVNEQQEINFYATSHLTRYWSVGYNQRIDLTKNGGTVEIGGKVMYEDECFKWEFRGEREFTQDRDYEGGLSLKMYFEMKPFGGFEI